MIDGRDEVIKWQKQENTCYNCHKEKTTTFNGLCQDCLEKANEMIECKAENIINHFIQNCSATVSKKDYDEVVRILNL